MLYISKDRKIGGPGRIVEIDESLFAKRKYKRGRLVKEKWFFGGIDRDCKTDVFLVHVPNRKAVALLPIIQQQVEHGTIIVSDEWKAYRRLSDEGYGHWTVWDKERLPATHNELSLRQSIEVTWRWCKQFLREKHAKHAEFLGWYVAEWLWRRVNCGKDKLDAILKDIAKFWPRGLSPQTIGYYDDDNDDCDETHDEILEENNNGNIWDCEPPNFL